MKIQIKSPQSFNEGVLTFVSDEREKINKIDISNNEGLYECFNLFYLLKKHLINRSPIDVRYTYHDITFNIEYLDGYNHYDFEYVFCGRKNIKTKLMVNGSLTYLFDIDDE